MASAILQQLDTYGPQHCEVLTYSQAAAYTQKLVRSQYENFSVVTWLLPRHLHEDFANVYAFCRWADDLGDETGDPRKSLELLAWWKKELADCYAGRPRHPVFVALAQTVERHEIPSKPFEDLIDAFEQDQRVHRYENWDQVVDYCKRSADPVGRIVLYMGCENQPTERMFDYSDATCTALQLVNFWQDVRRDIVERDRIYVPADALAQSQLTHDDMVRHVRGEKLLSDAEQRHYRAVIRSLVDRTWPLFEKGRQLLPLTPRDIRLPVRLFGMGGEAVMRAIEAMDYATLDHRPKLGKSAKAWLMLKAWIGSVFA